MCSASEQQQGPLETSLVTIAAGGSVVVTLLPWKRPPPVCRDIQHQGQVLKPNTKQVYEPVVHNQSFTLHRREVNACYAGVTDITKFSCSLISERANSKIDITTAHSTNNTQHDLWLGG